MLFFTKEEIRMDEEGAKQTCVICEKRRAIWSGVKQGWDTEDGIIVRKTYNMEPMCGWCVLYSNRCQWGYENRDELMHAGKAVQEHALRCSKPIPELDDCGRLSSESADKFLMGVAFTSKLLARLGMPMKYTKEAVEILQGTAPLCSGGRHEF